MAAKKRSENNVVEFPIPSIHHSTFKRWLEESGNSGLDQLVGTLDNHMLSKLLSRMAAELEYRYDYYTK